MAINMLLKENDKELLITKTHEPLIIRLLYTDWENKEIFSDLKHSDYGIMNCFFVRANNNIENFGFGKVIEVEKDDIKNVDKIIEKINNEWFIYNPSNNQDCKDCAEHLPTFLADSGLAEVFGKDFYDKMEQKSLDYKNNESDEFINCARL